MAFAQTADTKRTVMGNKRVHFGTFTQIGGDTGGVFTTGLSRTVEAFFCTGCVTWTATAGAVTATTLNPGAAQTGSWMAIGY